MQFESCKVGMHFFIENKAGEKIKELFRIDLISKQVCKDFVVESRRENGIIFLVYLAQHYFEKCLLLCNAIILR